jgi:phage terminase large subunit
VSNEPIELFPNERSPLYWANLTAKEDIVINQGGTYSSKSYSIIKVLFTIAVLRRGYVITVISNTVTKLKEDAIRIAKDIVDKSDVLKEMIASYNSTDRTYLFKNGSLIEFKSFETPEQAEGGKRDILYVNEAPRIPYRTFFLAQMRTRVRTFVDYNPTSTFWIHNNVLDNKAEYKSVKVIRSWHIHNPYLAQEQRDRIENIQDPELWKVYARGLTGKLKGTIYPNWDEVEEFNYSDGVVWWLDFGFSESSKADPTAGGKMAFHPKDSEYDFICKELIYTQGISSEQIVTVFRANGYKDGQIVYCDHAPAMINELRIHGISAVPAIKGPGSLLSGILFLRNKNVAYTKDSENIRMERGKYRFEEIEGIMTNTPADEWNHHMDGIRYAAYSHSLRTGRIK